MTEGRKDDSGKTRFSLLPFVALRSVVAVLEVGATKYGEDNWRSVKNAHRRYFDASLRHLAAYSDGERTDPETGLSHLAHAVCSLLFVIALEASDE